MEEQTLVSQIPAFDTIFPDKVVVDSREGYKGFIVIREFLRGLCIVLNQRKLDSFFVEG